MGSVLCWFGSFLKIITPCFGAWGVITPSMKERQTTFCICLPQSVISVATFHFLL